MTCLNVYRMSGSSVEHIMSLLDEKGNTLFHDVVMSNDVRAVILFVSNGANKDIRNKQGQTPLHCAAVNGCFESLRVLVNAGADKEAVDNQGRTPLHYAIYKGDAGSIEELIAKGANKEASCNHGNTPLHYAAMNAHVDIVKDFIARGVNIDVVDNNGNSPLYCAAYFGRKDVIRLLIAAHAYKESRNEKGYMPVHIAAYNGHVHAIRELLNIEESSDVHNGKPSITTLRSIDSAIRATDKQGNTPLHLAAYRGHVKVIKLLIALGAKKDAVNNAGCTPAQIAKKSKKIDIGNLIAWYTPEIYQDDSSQTLLGCVLQKAKVECAQGHPELLASMLGVGECGEQLPKGVASRVRGLFEPNDLSSKILPRLTPKN